MIKLIDLLLESKSSDLYTWVSKDKIKDIVNNNIIYGKFKHNINGKELLGNSLSRNKSLQIPIYYIRLTLDQEKLTNNYKIIPLDAEIIHRKIDLKDKDKFNKNRDRNPKKTNFFGDQPIRKDFDKDRFDEEFVVGDIKNISNYIKEILIIKPNWQAEELDNSLLSNLINYCKKHNIKIKQN